MEENPNIGYPNLVKPIINLFANEQHNSKYRQFLSDPENFKKSNKNFKDFIYSCIETFSKLNEVALEALPPSDSP